MNEKKTKKVIIRKLRKKQTKNTTKVVAITATMLAVALLMSGICAGNRWFKPVPGEGDPTFEPDIKFVQPRDPVLTGTLPEKLHDDHCATGVLDEQYMQ